ncbi:putative butyrophilin subfamily 2 member A3 isoform X2 [Epinephelus fuscoguttatus]|uniref:putative butyrophilin subfamily 2 member A3 isoform X2 n=1 Tax=Epinephelus fuscoguttatus TaxID=293821 RepID=UPI0020D020D4|nr:putative butyrophilin subfamily 2 member A3 isoform X2 [Epinephelus fuscoguttatus]
MLPSVDAPTSFSADTDGHYIQVEKWHSRPTSTQLSWLHLYSCCSFSASDQHVTVHPGDDVTLRCEADDVPIRAVEWTRPDLKPQYVFLYRDGNLDPTEQHPSFTGRVELVDRELKGGDVSLTLKNVTSRDSGTYECRVRSDGSRRRKRAIIKTAPITVIHLEVRGSEKENSMGGNTESEHPVNGNFPHGYVGLAAGVVAVLLVAAAVFAVWRYTRRMYQRSERPAAAEAGNNQFMFPSAVCDSST